MSTNDNERPGLKRLGVNNMPAVAYFSPEQELEYKPNELPVFIAERLKEALTGLNEEDIPARDLPFGKPTCESTNLEIIADLGGTLTDPGLAVTHLAHLIPVLKAFPNSGNVGVSLAGYAMIRGELWMLKSVLHIASIGLIGFPVGSISGSAQYPDTLIFGG